MSCLVCSSSSNYLFCGKCHRGPLKIEKGRQILARNGDLESLRKIYSLEFPEIVDLNSQIFWNLKKLASSPLKAQDGMTKDRIKTVDAFIPKGTKKILDIGVGGGWIEELLSKRKNLSVTGIDVSSHSISLLCERFQNFTFEKKSLYDLNFKKNSFNAVLLLEVMEHIPPSKIFNLLSKIRIILKKKGILIVSVPLNEGLEKMKINENGHVRMYTEELIKSELTLSGFEIISLKKFIAFSNFYQIKKLISKFLKYRWLPNNIVILAIKK